MIEDATFKHLVSLSSPRLWFLSAATFLLGVAMGLMVFGRFSAVIPTWHFVLFIFWAISVGMVAALSYARESPSIVFPWELIGNLKHLATGTGRLERSATISSFISGAFLVLLLLVNLVSLDGKIFVLSLCLLAADFIYDSPYIKEPYRSRVTVVYGAVLIIPLFVGYVFSTHTWPNLNLVAAGVCYGIAMGIYANAVRGEYFLSKNTSLYASALASVVCGYILSRYDVFYSLTVSSLLVVLILSALAKDSSKMHKIHDLAFYFHFVIGTLVGFHFFAA